MDERQVATAAKTLARWCYQRGLDERLLDADERLLRLATNQALGRRTPPERGPSQLERVQFDQALWAQTAVLLQLRRAWDLAHQITAPAAADCLWCAVDRQACFDHAPARCRVCGGALHPVVTAEGFDTHPCCDGSGGAGSDVGSEAVSLETTSQILGGRLMPEPT